MNKSKVYVVSGEKLEEPIVLRSHVSISKMLNMSVNTVRRYLNVKGLKTFTRNGLKVEVGTFYSNNGVDEFVADNPTVNKCSESCKNCVCEK